ncbi:MAG: tRNA (adenosine(37)-N6)-threonylcarbamoyltransferase complex dimerization subunit type 1 TsaB [Marinilabiliales bacterium]
MANIIGIETATEICSVALSINDKIDIIESNIKYSHSEKLSVFIDTLLKRNNLSTANLNAVVISAGPGSYTGLRIGVSVAKGLCYSLDIPMIAINTLKSMAYHFINKNKPENDSLICPLIDARRMEVYKAVYDKNLNIIDNVKAEIIDEKSFDKYLKKIHLFGSGAEKLKTIIKNDYVVFHDFSISAESLVLLGKRKWENKDFEDVAYFEPFYLKDFIALPAKNKFL